jgi:phosphoglucosamine mutase
MVEEQGFKTVRTKVGDTYVSERLLSRGDFGGEPSGAWVFPKNSMCPDGIYAAAMLASIASKDSLSSLVNAVPQYPIIRGSVPKSAAASGLDVASLPTKPVRVESTDGSKLIFDDGWVLIRPSGTEPKVRITAEGKTQAVANRLYDMVVKSIQQSGPGGKL